MLEDTTPRIRNSRSPRVESGRRDEPATISKGTMWQRLVRFSIIFALGWAVTLIVHGLVVPARGHGWPEDSFLFRPDVRFTDWTMSWAQGNKPNPYLNNGPELAATYFPFAYLFFRSLGGLSPLQSIFAYFAITFVAVGVVLTWWLRRQWKFWRGDSRWPVVALLTCIIVTCNYPLIFGVDRGNIDPIMMCVVYASIELARLRHISAGGILLAVGAASKAFPLAALLFWMRRRWFVGSAIAIVGFVALILLPASAFSGNVSSTLKAFKLNMDEFRTLYVLGSYSSHYSSDWLSGIRILARWRGTPFDAVTILYWYEKTTLVLAALLSLLAMFVIRETWRELLAIVLIMLVFPNVTNDYKLVFLLIPLLEWFVSPVRGWRSTVFGIGAALLLLPKHIYFPRAGDDASISCLMNPLLVLLVSAALLPTSDERARLRAVRDSALKRLRQISLGRGASAA